MRRLVAAIAAVLSLVLVTPAAPVEAAAGRCRVDSPCRPHDPPTICKVRLIKVLFPRLCARRVY